MIAEDGAGALDAVHEQDHVLHGRHLGVGGGGKRCAATEGGRKVLEGSGRIESACPVSEVYEPSR